MAYTASRPFTLFTSDFHCPFTRIDGFSPCSFSQLGGKQCTCIIRKHGSSVVCALASTAKGTRIDPRLRQGNFQCRNKLSFVSFAGMTSKECAICRIGMLTGGPMCRENHTLCRLKNLMVIRNGYLQAFILQKGTYANGPSNGSSIFGK